MAIKIEDTYGKKWNADKMTWEPDYASRERKGFTIEEIKNNAANPDFSFDLTREPIDVFVVGFITLDNDGRIQMVDKEAIEINGRVVILSDVIADTVRRAKFTQQVKRAA